MSLIALCGAVMASGCLFPTEQDPDTGRRVAEFQTVASVQETALLPLADTYLRQGAPNRSQGADPILRLQASGNNRALVRFDRVAIAAAVGAGTLQGARLELTIAVNADNWGTAGRTIDLHRLTQGWTEARATWNCADDANPANQSADCEGETAWQMGGSGPHPWEPAPAATATITNGLSGVVSLDVTADLAAVLAGGGEHHGWILKKTLEGQAGRVEFGSRESGIPPRLVMELAVGDTSRPVIPASFDLPDDSTRTVTAPWSTEARYYRDIVGVMFDDSTSGVRIQEILVKYQGVIIGGTGAFPATVFFVQVQDPGGTYEAIDRVANEIDREPGVLGAYIPTWRGRFRLKARYPNDGVQSKREDWFSATATDATRGLLAIRAPLAWGCENGMYGNTVKVAVIDREGKNHVDLPGVMIREPSGLIEFTPLPTQADLEHANQVAGILAAKDL